MASSPQYMVIEAPSVLGLWPSGVETMPDALQRAGLAERLRAVDRVRVDSLPYNDVRDSTTKMLNPDGIAAYARLLSDECASAWSQDRTPVIVGGDCSILLGPMQSLRKRGRYGLLFLDGHCDFCDPAREPNGEAASMDLALVTGRGPESIVDVDALGPFVRDEDVAQLGFRAFEDDTDEFEGVSIYDTDIAVFDLPRIRRIGLTEAAVEALEVVARPELDGFFVHVDCDVLADDVMPAVDYRVADGLGLDELAAVLRLARDTGRMAGVEFTIFNPTLDPDGKIAEELTDSIIQGLG
ncbi:MAG: arginase family protein [Candidatus Nanopelagicales bacterium]